MFSFRNLSLVWLIGLIGALIFSINSLKTGNRLDSSILALLPQEQQDPAVAWANQQVADQAERKLIILVQGQREPSLSCAQNIVSQFRDSGLFSDIQGAVSPQQIAQIQQQQERLRYYQLSAADRAALQQASAEQQVTLLNRSLSGLFSPLAPIYGAQLIKDPLQLHYHWQQQLNSGPFTLLDDWPTLQQDNRYYRLIAAQLNHSAFDIGYQQQVEQFFRQFNADLPPDITLLRSGIIFHASHGAQQARWEISTIGSLSVISLLLLIVLTFRSFKASLLVFLPVVAGLIFAIAGSLLIFGRLHLITLAFGAGLVGVAVDYSFHYLCARLESPTEHGRSVIRRIFPALTLGMVSSVIAYMAQTLAPFPGLQQMATFSALGLLGAWLTTVMLMPWLSTGRHNHQPKLLTLLESLRNHWPTFEQNRVKLALLMLLVGVTVAISQMQVSDDIRSLQTSTPQMLQNDANIARLSGAANPGQYFLLHANSAEQLLQREETLLAQLADSGVPLQATAQSMPSLAQQQKNHQLLQDHVYATQGLAHRLSQRLQQPALYDQMLSSFNQAPAPLNPVDWQPAADSPLALQWLGQYQGQFYSMVTVLGSVPQGWPETLDSLNVTGVQWVDRPQSLSNILQHYRQALLLWIPLAYACVALLLFIRFGLSAWRVIAAPALATLITLAALPLLGISASLFHMLALLLVLGIGLDAGIFLFASHHSSHSWLAVCLSAFSTLLAFGLLALCLTPVLTMFGTTVLIAISCVFLLTPVFTLRRQPEVKS